MLTRYISILVFLLALNCSAKNSFYYPIKKEAVGLTTLLKIIKEGSLDSAEKLSHAYGSSKSDKAGESRIASRYLYSPRWGWVDMKHVAAGAYQTSKAYLSGIDVLMLGQLNELYQLAKKEESAFSYEDFVSNLIGVYFESVYVSEKKHRKKNFIENLETYLTALGFVENPLEIAPNRASIPNGYDLSAQEIIHNPSYIPFYTTQERNTSLDKKILFYRKLVTGY